MRNHIKEAEEMLNRSQNLSSYMYIPTQLKEGELNQTPTAHPKLANYDHSLEVNRLASLRAKYDYVEPEHTMVELSTVEMSTKPYESIDPAEVPNMNGIFDNVFGL